MGQEFANKLSPHRLPLPFVTGFVVMQPSGVELVFFPCRDVVEGPAVAGSLQWVHDPTVGCVLVECTPEQFAGVAPGIHDDALLERLIACGYYQTIVLSIGSWKSRTPVKHQRLKPELFQVFADITRIMAA